MKKRWAEPYPRDPAVVAAEQDGTDVFASWLESSIAATSPAPAPVSEEPGDVFAALLHAQLNITAPEPNDPSEGIDSK